MELIDSHAHLTDTRFAADRGAVLQRAKEAGVVEMLTVGSGDGPEGAERAVALATETAGLWASVGVHPHEAALATEEVLAQLAALARHPRVVAWGEIGLDYHYPEPPPAVQKRALLRQLELARSARLPVIIHCRQAWDDCLAILEAEWKPTGLGGVLHCFSGTRAHAARGLAIGLRISFAANLTYPSAGALREVARWVPLDALLLETDSPYLPPQGRRGQRNEPALVVEVAKALANVRDLSAELVAAATAENFRRLFQRDGGGNHRSPDGARNF